MQVIHEQASTLTVWALIDAYRGAADSEELLWKTFGHGPEGLVCRVDAGSRPVYCTWLGAVHGRQLSKMLCPDESETSCPVISEKDVMVVLRFGDTDALDLAKESRLILAPEGLRITGSEPAQKSVYIAQDEYSRRRALTLIR